MSYDIEFADEWFNFTSNMSTFFTAFGVHPVKDMNGKPAAQVADLIDKALASLAQSDPVELSEKWDAPNGWGKLRHVIPFLERARDACRRNPTAIVQVD